MYFNPIFKLLVISYCTEHYSCICAHTRHLFLYYPSRHTIPGFVCFLCPARSRLYILSSNTENKCSEFFAYKKIGNCGFSNFLFFGFLTILFMDREKINWKFKRNWPCSCLLFLSQCCLWHMNSWIFLIALFYVLNNNYNQSN